MTRAIPAWIPILALVAPVAAASEPGPSKYDRFFGQAQPLLQAKCLSCHGPDKQEGGLRLDSAAALLEGGDNGPAVDLVDPEASPLLRSVRHQGDAPRMPPKERLKPAEVDALAAWVRDGAVYPAEVQVLVEDDPAILGALVEGEGSARLDPEDRAGGATSLVVVGQKAASGVPGWSFPIREHPGAGQYRYLRFAWKKRGGGALMVESARDGGWRSQGQVNASWVAGPNTTGWPTLDLGAEAPGDWTVVTRDLWADGGDWGDWSLTGLGVTAIDGGEACVDSMILGPTVESLDAYAPGRGIAGFRPLKAEARVGDAWSDPANPIRKIFRASGSNSGRSGSPPGLPCPRSPMGRGRRPRSTASSSGASRRPGSSPRPRPTAGP